MKKITAGIPAAAIVASLFLFSCNSGSDKKAEPEVMPGESDTVETVDTLLNSETISFFNHSGYSDYARSRLKNFDWSRFKLVDTWKDDSLMKSEFKPDNYYFERYGKFLKYSPDSSLFIDLDSYNTIIEIENGKLTGFEEGPDTEISLVDPSKKEKTRLIFLGPGGSVDEGGWLDKETLVLIGMQYNDEGTSAKPMIWKYHLPTSTFYLYESPDSVDVETQLDSWRKERLKGVELK
ncbi:MAG TPA: hypothetical protein PK339_15500 [Flavitalea sp.]|nr:hypothetical protein [Flavitalea sp.]